MMLSFPLTVTALLSVGVFLSIQTPHPLQQHGRPVMWVNDLGLESDLQTTAFSPSCCQSDLLLQHPLLVSLVLACYLDSSLQCGVDMLNPEVGELPGWRRGRETRELFALSGDIWDGEDNLIAVLALQEPRLDQIAAILVLDSNESGEV